MKVIVWQWFLGENIHWIPICFLLKAYFWSERRQVEYAPSGAAQMAPVGQQNQFIWEKKHPNGAI